MPTPEIIDLDKLRHADATIVFTYSGFLNDAGEYEASVLSKLNAEAAFLVAASNGSSEVVIAGEQSSSESRTTTGEVLADLALTDTPKVRPISYTGLNLLNASAIEVNTIPESTDDLSFQERYLLAKARNLNTGFQAELLAQELEPDQDITVVTAGFHANRATRNMIAHAKRFKHAEYITLDQIFTALRMEAAMAGQLDEFDHGFMQRHGLDVTFETVQRLALRQFAARENGPVMRLAHLVSPGARLHKVQSARSLVGRYDDIDAYGNAIMKSTR